VRAVAPLAFLDFENSPIEAEGTRLKIIVADDR